MFNILALDLDLRKLKKLGERYGKVSDSAIFLVNTVTLESQKNIAQAKGILEEYFHDVFPAINPLFSPIHPKVRSANQFDMSCPSNPDIVSFFDVLRDKVKDFEKVFVGCLNFGAKCDCPYCVDLFEKRLGQKLQVVFSNPSIYAEYLKLKERRVFELAKILREKIDKRLFLELDSPLAMECILRAQNVSLLSSVCNGYFVHMYPRFSDRIVDQATHDIIYIKGRASAQGVYLLPQIARKFQLELIMSKFERKCDGIYVPLSVGSQCDQILQGLV